ncbi:hypothetical protein NL676_004713 [Syzygium grande]|nr:hypothetical protein NL676_004713 [Syzygium grande]
MGGREGEDHADAVGTWHSEVREKQLRDERAELGEMGVVVARGGGDDGRGSTGYTWREARRGPDKAGCARHPSSSFAYFLSLSYCGSDVI